MADDDDSFNFIDLDPLQIVEGLDKIEGKLRKWSRRGDATVHVVAPGEAESIREIVDAMRPGGVVTILVGVTDDEALTPEPLADDEAVQLVNDICEVIDEVAGERGRDFVVKVSYHSESSNHDDGDAESESDDEIDDVSDGDGDEEDDEDLDESDDDLGDDQTDETDETDEQTDHEEEGAAGPYVAEIRCVRLAKQPR